MIENAIGRRRNAALRIFLSQHYPRPEGWARTLYVLGLLAMPRTFRAARNYLGMMRPEFVAPPPLPAAPGPNPRPR